MVTETAIKALSKAYEVFTEKIAPTLVVTAVAAVVAFGYNTGNLASKNADRLTNIEKNLSATEEALENTGKVVVKLAQDLAVLNDWRTGDFFKGERYDLAKGRIEETTRKAADERLNERINECRAELQRIVESVRDHNAGAERYKEKISNNEKAIEELRRLCNSKH